MKRLLFSTLLGTSLLLTGCADPSVDANIDETSNREEIEEKEYLSSTEGKERKEEERRQEAERQAEEQRRKEEEAERQREAERKAEEQRQAEARRQEEERQREAEEQGRREEEAERKAEEQRQREAQQAQANVNVTQATVSRVIDGDTLELSNGQRVRLIGVDTPERGRSGADAAAAFTRSRVEGRTVWLESDGNNTDRHGRLRRYVWMQKPTNTRDEAQIRSKMLNAQLLSNGHAQVAIFGNVRNEALFRSIAR